MSNKLLFVFNLVWFWPAYLFATTLLYVLAERQQFHSVHFIELENERSLLFPFCLVPQSRPVVNLTGPFRRPVPSRPKAFRFIFLAPIFSPQEVRI